MRTNPHKTTGLFRPCTCWDLFTVREGLQCGNCLVLVQDNRTQPDPTPAEMQAREDAHWAPVFAQPGYPFQG